MSNQASFSFHKLGLIRCINLRVYQCDGFVTGYLDFTHSQFSYSDWGVGVTHVHNASICYYTDYREPYNSPEPYARTMFWWQALAARLAFILVFDRLVYMSQTMIKTLIPRTPKKIQLKMKKASYLARQAFLKQTLLENYAPTLPNPEVNAQ